jgi:DNA-3-methyladenine glycosylase II
LVSVKAPPREKVKISKKPPIESTIRAVLARSDPRLGRVIKAVISRLGPQHLRTSQASPFEALVRAIVFQSVSGKAASTIYKRLQELTKPRPLSPRILLATETTELRAVGLSRTKIAAMRSLATWFEANGVVAAQLPELPDETVVDVLTNIRGIGRWTANVFLIFTLGRLDVMPANDLGIRRGVQLTYGLKSVPDATVVGEKALRWRPYRSVASIYLWQAVKLKLGPRDLP